LFADANAATGSDVFLVTRQRLVSSDRDNLIDLYDARVGGGFPDSPPVPTPCIADECQGLLSGTPPLAGMGSVAFVEPASAGQTPRFNVAGSVTIVGSVGHVRVRVPRAGSLVWAGSGIRHAHGRAGRAGVFTIKIALSPSARRIVVHRDIYRSHLKLTFASAGHSATVARVRLTFKTKTSKKGRGRS
jgi:hypothetical protein